MATIVFTVYMTEPVDVWLHSTSMQVSPLESPFGGQKALYIILVVR